MWRRLQILPPIRSATSRLLTQSDNGRAVLTLPAAICPRLFSTVADATPVAPRTVEDILPIATGHEREEIEADLKGEKRFDMDAPCGPFGTKEAPAIIQSYFDKRIVGCPGGEGEEEHDVVWFWLEKGKPHECPVCFQYFMLEVVGSGGSPDGHDDEHGDGH
ncbi:Cytochrome c oxidase subunit Vb [Zostera marina]|uniref:Cytochrome c oxidase subunit Vb n=1 Tax=Zostera marina TaxID=29655 RepID=A0A0K9NTI7_ZOSMR|nr:Cytochrome c oxidase subunit Vb [Zostera marina]